jgi:hypothetical protein
MAFSLSLYNKNYKALSVYKHVSVCPSSSELSLLNFAFLFETNFITEKEY